MKIKTFQISRTLLLILCVGVFVIALAGLLFLYLGEVQEKKDLEQDLTSTKSEIVVIELNIDKSDKDITELEGEIAQTKALTAGIKTQLQTSLLTSDIFADMLAIARATNVDLAVIGESGVTDGTIAGVPYKLRTISFTAEGSALNIYNFVDKLSQDLNTSILNRVKISDNSDPSDPTADTSAGMQLTIYSY